MSNSDVADAKEASASSKEELIRRLGLVVFSSTLKGAEYGDAADQLKLHASEELAHALEVARQIDYLSGDPTGTVKDAEYSQESKKILEIDLKQEQDHEIDLKGALGLR